MGDKQNALLEYILTLTPEQVEKALQHLPELKAAITEEAPAA